MPKSKRIAPIPDEFSSLEEAAAFWDAHDTTDYPNAFQPVEAKTELRKRHFEIEVGADVVSALRKQARRKGVSSSRLASEILRQRLTSAK